MTDDPRYRTSDRYGERERDLVLHDLIEHAVRRVSTSLVIAGGLIGLGLYMSAPEASAPSYQMVTTADGQILRLNTDSGRIVSCRGERCGLVLERGQDIDDDPPAPTPEATPAPDARPALPAPSNEAAAAPEGR